MSSAGATIHSLSIVSLTIPSIIGIVSLDNQLLTRNKFVSLITCQVRASLTSPGLSGIVSHKPLLSGYNPDSQSILVNPQPVRDCQS